MFKLDRESNLVFDFIGTLFGLALEGVGIRA